MKMDEVKGLNDALLFVGSFFPEDEVFVIEKNIAKQIPLRGIEPRPCG